MIQKCHTHTAQTDLGCGSGVGSDVEHQSAGDQADERHEVEGKAPAFHAKRHCRTNVCGKEPTNHASWSAALGNHI